MRFLETYRRRLSGGLVAFALLAAEGAGPTRAQEIPGPSSGALPGGRTVMIAPRFLTPGGEAQGNTRYDPTPAVNLLQQPADTHANLHTYFVVQDPSEGLLGATLQPADESLRAQLKLPDGEGLLVASVTAGGPAEQAGLKANDVLLRLEKHALAKPEDLTAALRAAGEGDTALALLREGKPMNLAVRPVHRVTIGPAAVTRTTYYLGISAEPVSEALRVHLKLRAGLGLVASQVVPDSPAEKAGLKSQDVLIGLDEHPLESVEGLQTAVQALRDKPARLKFLRGGKEQVEMIAAAPRQVEMSGDVTRQSIRLWNLGYRAHPEMFAKPAAGAENPYFSGSFDTNNVERRLSRPEGPDSRLDAIDAELKELKGALQAISESLKGLQGTPKKE